MRDLRPEVRNSVLVRVCLTSVFAFLAVSVCPAAEIICFEAESAAEVAEPMRITDATKEPEESRWPMVQGSSGKKYLEIPQGTNETNEAGTEDETAERSGKKGDKLKEKPGHAVFTFEVRKPGRYYLWCRVWWLDTCGNSFFMSMDKGTRFVFGDDRTCGCWHWVKIRVKLAHLKLAEGKHTLKVMHREDGVRLDQILLVNDRRYVPVGVEDVTGE